MDISSTTFNQYQRGDTVSNGTKPLNKAGLSKFQAEVEAQVAKAGADAYAEKNSHKAAVFAAPPLTVPQIAGQTNADLPQTQREVVEPEVEGAVLSVVNSNKGDIAINLDEYFSDDPKVIHADLRDVPLLLPSRENIKALSEHASQRFQQLLSDYDILAAPESITYNNEGKMILPADYPHANELKAALEQNPGLDRELRSLNAISSHFVEIQKRMPFVEAMQLASSQAEIDQLIEKYSHLLNDNHNYSSIALRFSKAGSVSVSADGKPVQLA